jgi:hypothetical protein
MMKDDRFQEVKEVCNSMNRRKLEWYEKRKKNCENIYGNIKFDN